MEKLEESLEVVLVEEDLGPAIAAVADVVDAVRDAGTRWSGHASNVARSLGKWAGNHELVAGLLAFRDRYEGQALGPGRFGPVGGDDGTLQVTYAKHPLYYFAKDARPGQITCQNVSNFGGLWLVVAPNGKPVR